MKDAFLRMMSVALDRKGTPLTVVFVDPNTTIIDEEKLAQNNGQTRGKQVGMRADLAARAAFKNIHNDSVIFLPGKKDQIFSVQDIPQNANVEDFMRAIEYCDRSVLRALLIPALIFSAGDGSGSYALGETHDRTWDKVCDSFNAGLTAEMLDQIVRQIILYNFDQSVIEKDGLGEFGKRELTAEERQKEMEVLSKANDMGAVDMTDIEDVNEVRSRAGLAARTELIPIQPDQQFEQEMNEQANEDKDKGDGEGKKEKKETSKGETK